MKRKALIICLVVMILCSAWLFGWLLYLFINDISFYMDHMKDEYYFNKVIIPTTISVLASFLFLVCSSLFIYLLIKREHILSTKEEVEARKQIQIQKREQKKQAKIAKLQKHIDTLKKDG